MQVPPLPPKRLLPITAADYEQFNNQTAIRQFLSVFRAYPSANSCVASGPHPTEAQFTIWVSADTDFPFTTLITGRSLRIAEQQALSRVAAFGVNPSDVGQSIYLTPLRLAEHLRPYVGKCPNIFLPMTLDFLGEEFAHSNLILLKQIGATHYQIERWDPWTEWDENIDLDLERLFNNALILLGYRSSYSEMDAECPVGYDIQTMAHAKVGTGPATGFLECFRLDILSPLGLCTLWVLVYLVLRVYAPNQALSVQELTGEMRKWLSDNPGAFCLFAYQVAATLIRQSKALRS